MKIVKLTFNYDWPLFRQTPNFSQIWGNFKFIIDDNLKECDFWIIYTDYKFVEETVKCNSKNIIFIPGECYNTSPKFTQKFLDQFGVIITVQREISHKNIIYSHNANPWFISKSFDELNILKTPNKTKLISVISSNKIITKGHKKRLDFVEKLKKHFGEASYKNGQLNRAYIAAEVFNNKEKLELLSSIVHPATIADGEKWMQEQTTPYAIKEAAIIFESGSQRYLDFIIGVSAPVTLRIFRSMKRDNLSKEEVNARMDRQMDVVVIDATEPIKNYAVIPLGRARESVAGLRRAQIIILTTLSLPKTRSLNLIILSLAG